MRVYALSIHADYKCRHSGACCSVDWDVPVELPVYRGLRDALERGRLTPASPTNDPPFLTEPDLPPDTGAMLARTSAGDCVFFHRGTGLCVVHRDLGEPALPATCRHFPRIAVRDWRGTFLTLSHFCPTAASMLFRDDVPLDIVESPAAFPPADYDGLRVAADAWPPLLHPRMLMDVEGYSAWERHMVGRCTTSTFSPETILATLFRDARLLRRWTPALGPLADAVASLPADAVTEAPEPTLARSLRLYRNVLAAVPDDLKPPCDEQGLEPAYVARVLPAWNRFHGPLARFLAAKAFASWTAYQGRGILTNLRGLESALAVVRVDAARFGRDTGRLLDADGLRESFRAADFLLNHLAVAEDLAAVWSQIERTATPSQ